MTPANPAPLRLAYAIGQYPAINHGYLLFEIRCLRRLGIAVETASISRPDRPADLMTPEEAEETALTYYIKSNRRSLIAAHFATFLRRPWPYLSGLLYSLSLASGPRSLLYHVFYFVEAVALGSWMRKRRLGHVHASFCATVAMIAARVFPITISFGVYGYGELFDPARTHLADKIDAALFVRAISAHTRNELMLAGSTAGWNKFECVPLGVDSAAFPPRPFRESPDPFRILCVGRLSPEKGQLILLAAMQRLASRCPRAVLHLVGGGPHRPVLEKEAARRGLARNVVFEGRVDQHRLLELYQSADAFALASLYEGTPVVLMEAMCMEIPCIAPCITGIPELIRDGDSGLLFPPASDAELAAALARLVESPDLCRRLGRAARAHILRRYDLARNTEALAAVLRRRLT